MYLKACLLVSHMHAFSFIVDVEDAAHQWQRRLASAPGRLDKSTATVTPAYDDYAPAVPDSTHAPTPKMKPNKKAVETSEDSYDAGAILLSEIQTHVFFVFLILSFPLVYTPRTYLDLKSNIEILVV